MVIDRLMIILAKYLVVVLAGFLIYLFIKKRKSFVFVFLGMLASLVISRLIKLIYYVPRPFVDGARQLVEHVADSSFPSDHAVAFFSTAFALLLVKERKAGIVFLILGVLIGFARVFVGVHYPIDIAGSLLVSGIGVGLVYCFIWKKLNSKSKTLPVF